VQRLFELQKCHVAETGKYPSYYDLSVIYWATAGYKLRTYIGKHLKSRSETIRKALNSYNFVARALQKPTLNFQDIVKLSFVSEFDLLKDSRRDIRERIWTNPQARMVCNAYFRSKRAHEELQRLSVEVRRVVSWITFQETRLQEAVQAADCDVQQHGGGTG
jgi:hypothetical protein